MNISEFSLANQNKPQPSGEMQRAAAIGDGLSALYHRQFGNDDVNTILFLRTPAQHYPLNTQKQSPAERLLEVFYHQRNNPEMFQQRHWPEREVRPYGEENVEFHYTDPRTESMLDENEMVRNKKFVDVDVNPTLLQNFGSQKRGNLLRLAHQAARGFGK